MKPKTKSERFVLAKKEQWEKLHHIVLLLSKKGYTSLSPEDILAFPRIYRLICADLAEAKMLQLSPDVLDYLNQLIGQAHKFLYSFPPLRRSQIKTFFSERLPFIMLKNWMFLLISALIFFSSYAITFGIVIQNPSVAGIVVPQSTLHQMEEAYSEEISEERSFTLKNFMVSFYIQNNISIAFASFALGVLLGIGTIYVLIYNGVFLGAITGYLVAGGKGRNLLHFVTAHSITELTGLVLAGAAGLALGFSIIKATRYYRKEWMAFQRKNIFTLIAASGFLLLIAALIEGLISPSLIPYTIKVNTAILSLLFIIGYFFIWPRIKIIQSQAKGNQDE